MGVGSRVDADTGIDQQPRRFDMTVLRGDVKCRQARLLDERVDAILDQRLQQSNITPLRGHKPDSAVDGVHRGARLGRWSARRLAGSKNRQQQQNAVTAKSPMH